MSRNPGGVIGIVRAVFGFGGGDAVEADLTVSHRSRKAVRIKYKNNRGQTSERLVDVLGIGHGYIDAFDRLRGEVRTFRISRVRWTELTETPFELSSDYVPSGWVSSGRGEFRR